jgi:hypothetical protein
MSAVTRPMPADVSNSQSVPAKIRVGSPTILAVRSRWSEMTSGCFAKLVSVSIADDERLIGAKRGITGKLNFVLMARIGEWQQVRAVVGVEDRW